MAARLSLENPNQNSPSRILLYINHNYKKYKFSIGEKIEPRYWNPKQQMARANYPFRSELNQRLKTLTDNFDQALQQLLRKEKEVSREAIIAAYQKLQKNGEIKKSAQSQNSYNFFNLIEQFISDCESGKRLINGRRYSKHTIKGYKVTRNHLINFQTYLGKKIAFSKLNKEFYDEFVAFFYQKDINKGKDEEGNPITEKGHTINSVGKHIKNLKVFANYAAEKGITIHPEFFRKSFKVLAEDTDQVALSVSELQMIENVELESAKLDHVRDCFLLAAYTGLRFSDLQLLTTQHFITGDMLKIKTQKTGQKVVIPLHRTVKAILKKHDGIPPTPYSNQKMNEYLKLVCEKAGITEMVSASKTRAGSKETLVVPKYSLVSVHTARRSFATNLYLAGMDIMSIKKMTGHHTEKSFLKYIRVSEEENAEKAAKHAFFQ
jgi:integrase